MLWDLGYYLEYTIRAEIKKSKNPIIINFGIYTRHSLVARYLQTFHVPIHLQFLKFDNIFDCSIFTLQIGRKTEL